MGHCSRSRTIVVISTTTKVGHGIQDACSGMTFWDLPARDVLNISLPSVASQTRDAKGAHFVDDSETCRYRRSE